MEKNKLFAWNQVRKRNAINLIQTMVGLRLRVGCVAKQKLNEKKQHKIYYNARASKFSEYEQSPQ